MVYDRYMKRRRILSIAIIAIGVITVASSVIIIACKNHNKPIYATSINYIGSTKGAEILIDNELVLDASLIKIEPSNCTFKPEFSIRKSGENSEKSITESKYTFAQIGTYVLSCKIKAGKNYYINDKITLTVVNNPSETTSMYIIPNYTKIMYLDDELNLDEFADIVSPTGSKIDVNCTPNVVFRNNKIVATGEGMASVTLTITYDSISVCKAFNIIVRPKIDESEVGLELTIGATPVTNNIININSGDGNIIVDYILTNIDEQEIDCRVDGDAVTVEDCYVPTIILKPEKAGQAILYITSVKCPSVTFEITINVQ